MIVFQCEDCFESILCGVYDAFQSRLGHQNIRLEMKDQQDIRMFTEYRKVVETEDKFQKVKQTILEKVGQAAYEAVFRASLSQEADRADRIYRYLIYGFHYGSAVTDMLQIPAVYEIFVMGRSVGNEAHLLTGFVRFAEMEEGFLLGKIEPKNDVLMLLAPHFADRLSGENWVLYDVGREKAAVHPADGSWVVARMDSAEWRERLKRGNDEALYENLWKAFHRTIAIRERSNPVCQRTHLPLRYRSNMTEFQEEQGETGR
ncbi:MAG: TIGR03915 family putative DNA repair protein [Hungatella sp.]